MIPLAVLILFPALSSFGQGSLTPPGAPGPTMKTLQQVEPRTPISSVPFTITSPGSYYLTTNLTGTAGQNGITILANAVTLDLMGFDLAGAPGSVAGIFVSGIRTGIAVRNGTVRNWDGDGIDTGSASNSQYEGLRLSGNSGRGLRCGSSSTIIDCTASFNITNGIAFAVGCLVRGNTCHSNGSSGGGAGILASPPFLSFTNAAANRIEGNNVTYNDRGIVVDTTGNIILGNTAGANLNNYDIAAGNSFGPIVDVSGVGDISGTADADHPWANFEF